MAKQEFITAYHGTTDKNLASIQRNGLQAGKSKGADTWAKRHSFLRRNYYKRKPSVFVSLREGDAAQFSKYATEVNGGAPIVLALRIPTQEFETRYKPDEAAMANSLPVKFRTEGTIPPAYIADVENWKGRTIFDWNTGGLITL